MEAEQTHWSVAEVAEKLKKHRSTIEREIRRKKLGSAIVAGEHVITLPDLIDYLGDVRARFIFLSERAKR